MKKQISVVLAVVLLVVGGSAIYLYVSNESSNERADTDITQPRSTKKTAKDSDVIATFSGGPVLGQTVTTEQDAQEDTQAVTEQKSVKLFMPDGWNVMSSTTSETSECDPTKPQTVAVYQKGDETITVYENATPAGCDNSTIGDVNLSFSYAENVSVKVDKSSGFAQCTKDQNSTCPKGDGKVTIFVTSEAPNPLNGNMYAFRIDDSKIDADFNAQVAGLVSHIDQITFGY